MPAPLVSVLIPTRDRAHLLARCLDDLLTCTDYPNLEIIIIDNESRTPEALWLLARIAGHVNVRVLSHVGPFNWSAMNNRAARIARGDILLLLNNDINIRHPDWLHEMVALALRTDIGVVGAKLLYPNTRIQHAGISLSAGTLARHVFRHEPTDAPGHANMLRMRRSVAAVTGACLAVRRAVFREVDGLEEEHLGVTNGDIDLCLRVRARGYRVIWTPCAELTHVEGATRGSDQAARHRARLQRERDYLIKTWGDLAEKDPYLNPNLRVSGERLVIAPVP